MSRNPDLLEYLESEYPELGKFELLLIREIQSLFPQYRTQSIIEGDLVNIETDMLELSEDLFHSVVTGRKSSEEAEQWLAEWGPRRHNVDVEIEECRLLLQITWEDVPHDCGHVEEYVLACERLLEKTNKKLDLARRRHLQKQRAASQHGKVEMWCPSGVADATCSTASAHYHP